MEAPTRKIPFHRIYSIPHLVPYFKRKGEWIHENLFAQLLLELVRIHSAVERGLRGDAPRLVKPEDGTLEGVCTHLIFKGVHYEMEVMAAGREWLVHSTHMFPVGTEVGIHVDPFNIQIMNKPESEDEEATVIEE